MTRKQQRAILIIGSVATITLAVILIMIGAWKNSAFFYAPSDVATKSVPPGQRFRLGGLVKAGSVKRGVGTKVSFSVTDTIGTIPVIYEGSLPDLFREGQGVVAEGKLDARGVFHADTVLAKHDENYMPPEVAAALKAKGVKLGKGSVHRPGGKAGGS